MSRAAEVVREAEMRMMHEKLLMRFIYDRMGSDGLECSNGGASAQMRQAETELTAGHTNLVDPAIGRNF